MFPRLVVTALVLFVSASTNVVQARETVTLPTLGSADEVPTGKVPNPWPPSERVGFAVVGLGHLALENIIPAFGQSKYARLAALVSGDRRKMATIGEQYGIAPAHQYTYDQFEKLKDDPDVKVIYIVLPNAMHKEYTLRAAKIGKAILCEKPMATTPEDAQAMIDAAHRAGVPLMIAYRMQYEPYNRAMIELTRKKTLGDLKAIVAENTQSVGDPKQWRLNEDLSGGGPLPDVGIYAINAARYITGEEPVEVSAIVTRNPKDPRFSQVEESVNWMMRFPSGVVMNGYAGYNTFHARRYRLYFTKGWAELDPAFAYNGLRMKVAHLGPSGQEVIEERIMPVHDQFATEMDHMARCVVDHRPPRTPGEEGLQDVKIITALYRSAAEHKPEALPVTSTTLDATRGPALPDND